MSKKLKERLPLTRQMKKIGPRKIRGAGLNKSTVTRLLRVLKKTGGLPR